MGLITLFMIAVGLSMDAFAVSITNGMCSNKVSKKNAIVTAFTFGFFQAMMPVAGYFLGRTFSDFISKFQHWVALLLLGAIGINMIADTIKELKNPEETVTKEVFTAGNLIVQGIATSIDALAVGVSFAVLKINIIVASLFIGFVTFSFCIFGVLIGKKFGNLLGARAKLLGGIILILIGLKIFIEQQFL